MRVLVGWVPGRRLSRTPPRPPRPKPRGRGGRSRVRPYSPARDVSALDPPFVAKAGALVTKPLSTSTVLANVKRSAGTRRVPRRGEPFRPPFGDPVVAGADAINDRVTFVALPYALFP